MVTSSVSSAVGCGEINPTQSLRSVPQIPTILVPIIVAPSASDSANRRLISTASGFANCVNAVTTSPGAAAVTAVEPSTPLTKE